MQGGLASWLHSAPIPLQWMVVADDETVKFEAESESQKEVRRRNAPPAALLPRRLLPPRQASADGSLCVCRPG